jgi:hypothetical protein
MKQESGAPAFDNVEDVLAERIVKHGKQHSGMPDEDASASNDPPCAPSPPEAKKNRSCRLIILLMMVLCGLLLLSYRLSHHWPDR